jgi:hypothetical protein
LWNFGDGTTDTSASPKKHYDSTMSYNVKLQCTSNNGCVAYQTYWVDVIKSPSAGALIGQNNGLIASLPYVYNVAQQLDLTYKWSIVNGIIVTGQGTSVVTAQWVNNGKGYIKVEVTNSQNCSDTNSMSISIGNVGIKEIQSLSQLELYPNPNNGEFTIKVTCNGHTTHKSVC